MKTLKTLAIIGIVISVIGIIGSFILLGDEDVDGLWALVIYGYFLAFSIVALVKAKKENGS